MSIVSYYYDVIMGLGSYHNQLELVMLLSMVQHSKLIWHIP